MTAIPESVRAEFPILAERTYVVNHSLGAVPASTKQAMEEFVDAWATLGPSAWEGPWWATLEEFCANLEHILGGAKGTVVPMQNATRAMAAVASGLTYRTPRNRVVMTELEFTTFYPFWRNQETLGAELVVVPSDDQISVPVERIVKAIDDRTLIVPTCDVYFRSGARQDLKAIVQAAHEHGAMVIGDGYQAVGCVPVDVKKLGIDFYVGGSHKWLCGGAGAGFLYVRPDLAATFEPRLTGWFGLADPFAYEKDLSGKKRHPGAFRFMDGTPNVPALYGAREGVRAIRRVGVDNIHRHNQDLTERLRQGATERGLEIRSPADRNKRSAMTCLAFDGSQETCAQLNERGVMVDWRPGSGIRVSPHFYSTRADIDAFFEALDAVRVRGSQAAVRPA